MLFTGANKAAAELQTQVSMMQLAHADMPTPSTCTTLSMDERLRKTARCGQPVNIKTR